MRGRSSRHLDSEGGGAATASFLFSRCLGEELRFLIMAEDLKREIGPMKPCPDCNATGAAPVRDSKGRPHAGRDLSKNCETCGGTGYIPDLAGDG